MFGVKRVIRLRHANLWNVLKSKRKMSTVQIRVAQGTCVGLEDTLPNGKPYYTFKGVPYAQAPIGNLRFQEPKPLDKFAEPLLDCSVERDVSFHKDLVTAEFIGSEDSLHLNVYTPISADNVPRTKPLAVMVWIHGGAYMSGSGNSDYYSPEYLVQEEVIVVTLNYRLGPMGFLCLPEAGVSGNAGLKDQLLALKWVNQNIANFGGDPNNVTLFGESAGGSAVHLHALSKVSRKYFHKAICQSGTSIMEWAVQYNPVEKSKKIAELLGCKSDSQKEILDYLVQVDSLIEFNKKSIKTLNEDEKRRGLPIPFRPCVEADSPSAIISKPPLDLLNEPNSIDIPIMMGYNSEEGLIMLMDMYKKFDTFEKDLAKMIPRSLNLKPDDPECLKLAAKMKDFYFNNQKITKKLVDEMCRLQTDYHFAIGAHLTAELHARKQHKSPLYFYRFSFDDELNIFKRMLMLKLNMFFSHLKGASHGDEMFYLFNLKAVQIERKEDALSTKIAKQMCIMWTNFAKYSNPTPDHDNQLSFKWEPVQKTPADARQFNLDYLEINENIKMSRNPDMGRIAFWRDLFIEKNGSFLKPKL